MTNAQTILAQLGGNKFLAMTGARNLVGGKNSLSMKIGRNSKGVTHVRITLDANDLYAVEFFKIRGADCTTLASREGVYSDSLQTVFTFNTGLDTRM